MKSFFVHKASVPKSSARIGDIVSDAESDDSLCSESSRIRRIPFLTQSYASSISNLDEKDRDIAESQPNHKKNQRTESTKRILTEHDGCVFTQNVTKSSSAAKRWYQDSDDEYLDEESFSESAFRADVKEDAATLRNSLQSKRLVTEEDSQAKSYRTSSMSRESEVDADIGTENSRGPLTDHSHASMSRPSHANDADSSIQTSDEETFTQMRRYDNQTSSSNTKDVNEDNMRDNNSNKHVAIIDSVIRKSYSKEKRISSNQSSKQVVFTNSRSVVLERHDLLITAHKSLAPNTTKFGSPTHRNTLGASPGSHGSGVLLEGWLRQKQRRGVKGMRKWNSRYFVLYARSKEIRYYADVVTSAWGPIPLAEIGVIALRLVQSIEKPSHPKYKGSRFDLTCKSVWGTHYADTYILADSFENGESYKPVADKNTSDHSSRVYSLMADSPQTAVLWVNTIDALLLRKGNRSTLQPTETSIEIGSIQKPTNAVRALKRLQRRQPFVSDDAYKLIFQDVENIPSVIKYAISFIDESTPGIETEHFYEHNVSESSLKSTLQLYCEYSAGIDKEKDASTRFALDKSLDAAIAGKIIKLWLHRSTQPLIPIEFYKAFVKVAHAGMAGLPDFHARIKAQLATLPSASFKKLACLLFHWNDVNAYASKNKMDSLYLAQMFATYILRPQQEVNDQSTTEIVWLMRQMIENVDAVIDEKELQQSSH